MISISRGPTTRRGVHWYSSVRMLTVSLHGRRGVRICFGRRRADAVSNLLAVLCSDGGQYLDHHGLEDACARAEKRWAELRLEAGQTEHERDNLVSALIGPDWDDAESEEARYERALHTAHRWTDVDAELAATKVELEALKARTMTWPAVAELVMSIIRQKR